MKPILIVDDDPRNIFALRATLSTRGMKCISASDARQALAYLHEHEPAVVLLDMMMPDLDGYEAIPMMRERYPTLPVFAVTAQAMPGDREKCIEAGASEYLAKPIDVDRLLMLIEKHT